MTHSFGSAKSLDFDKLDLTRRRVLAVDLPVWDSVSMEGHIEEVKCPEGIGEGTNKQFYDQNSDYFLTGNQTQKLKILQDIDEEAAEEESAPPVSFFFCC